ncbi:hypothetical protein ACFRAI_39665 [Streptomyces sp. NPDC056637]|uniref:hypothetical protein n=1 Tax=unclassified Streptomyces TaxID=2593676 RepID=UPI00363B4AB5
MNASTGKVAWQLPDPGADRIAPDVTAVWHGRVYGKTAAAPSLWTRSARTAPRR